MRKIGNKFSLNISNGIVVVTIRVGESYLKRITTLGNIVQAD